MGRTGRKVTRANVLPNIVKRINADGGRVGPVRHRLLVNTTVTKTRANLPIAARAALKALKLRRIRLLAGRNLPTSRVVVNRRSLGPGGSRILSILRAKTCVTFSAVKGGGCHPSRRETTFLLRFVGHNFRGRVLLSTSLAHGSR